MWDKEFDMPKLPPDNKEHDIEIEKININSNVLSNPAIIKDGDKLICNYKKIMVTVFKGPICPDLYSQPTTLNIISLSDETIKAEIIEIGDNNISEKDNGENSPNAAPPSPDKPNGEEVKEKIDKELKEIVDTEGEKNGNFEVKEDDIEHIEELERKDIENNIYMRLEKSEIKSKNEIQIKITIPENINKEKKEIQIIKRKLKLTSTSSNANGEVEIEMKILTVPIELLISCENYKLEYINGVYHLKTYQLFSKEKIIFKIQNYLKGEENIIKARMEYLEGNTPGDPIDLKEEKDKLIVTLPDIKNEPKRVNYKIECYISKNYNIPIIIDSAIIPIDYSFQVWDFLSKNFKTEKLEILLPIIYYSGENYFTKYNDENEGWLEINLNFIIKVPGKNRKTKAKIRGKASGYNYDYIKFEKEKEIDIDDEIKNIEYKLEINCENIIHQDIGYCECEIEGQIKRIQITKKNCECLINRFDCKNIDLFELQKGNNDLNEIPIKSFDKIKDKIYNKKGIYICILGF